MNVLGIDHGTKRIGLAVGSTETGVAVPFALIGHHGEETLVSDIKAIVISERIDQIVVGLPLSKDGSSSSQAEQARAFAARLENALSVPVVLEDERLSSKEIEAQMEGLGGRKAWKAAKLDRDSAAAMLFLQTYLDRLKNA